MRTRCAWVTHDPLYIAYHDAEWGVPLRDDAKLFELLVLETFQAGLSWLTVLKKRENFRAAFDRFDAEKIARYDEAKLESRMADSGIIRNRLKVQATVANARAFLDAQASFGSFADYVWDFVGGEPQVNAWASAAEVPATTPLATVFSTDLKQRGFRFVGPTVAYAFMQASGMVMDHTKSCFRHAELI
ncbi:DNA-3-methyladenine glycosylase I [soil metagenome]